MATVTLTSAGVTNPSSTTIFYTAESSARPPASGAFPDIYTEFSDSEYSATSVSDNTRVDFTPNTAYDYTGMAFSFYVPAIYSGITNLAFGVEGYANDGYANDYGFALYARTQVPTWVFVGNSLATNTDSTRTGSTTAISTYMSADPDRKVHLLILSKAQDPNGNGAEVHCDYAYLTVTYTTLLSSSLPRLTLLGVG